MRPFFKRCRQWSAWFAALAAVAMLLVAAPAQAQFSNGGEAGGPSRGQGGFHHHRGGLHGGAAAVGLGIIGLGAAAIILPRLMNPPARDAVYEDDELVDEPTIRQRPPRARVLPGAPGGNGGNAGRSARGAGPGAPGGMPPRNETRFVPDEIVFVTRAGLSPAQLAALARRYGLTRIEEQTFRLIGTTLHRYRIAANANLRAVIARLARDARVGFVQPNYVYALTQAVDAPAPAPAPAATPAPASPPASPPAAVQPASSAEGKPAEAADLPQYAIETLKLPEAHRIATGRQVLVAVIDSGIDATHPALAGAVVQSFDSLENPNAPPEAHGTGMAGAIAARARLQSAAPSAQILAARAFGPAAGKAGAQGTTFHILRSIEWAYEQRARVVNMSFAGPRDPLLSKMLAAAAAKDMILVAAAGNAGPKAPPAYPGADPNVIAVTATDARNELFAMANRGRYIDVAAPGVDVLVAAPDDKYEFTTGTSVATAYVSGVVALMLERQPALTAARIRKVLSASGVPIKAAGPGNEARLTDADAAVKLVGGRP